MIIRIALVAGACLAAAACVPTDTEVRAPMTSVAPVALTPPPTGYCYAPGPGGTLRRDAAGKPLLIRC